MEKQLLKKSGILAIAITFILLAFWFGFSKLSLGAYNEKNLTYQFLKEDSEVFKTLVIEVGSDTVARIIVGTSSMVRTGTSSYPYQPRIQYDGATGLWTFKNSGGTTTTAFGTVTAAYVAAEIGSTAANYVLKNDGSSTGQLATNPTLAGVGTITASFGANGLVITPAEYSAVNNATGELQSQITTATGSITNHTHTGSDGTTQVSHTNLTSKGTQTHTQIDDFIASKASASGVASLDANSLVVQNPASGTSTPGASKTVMSDGTGKILDGWLSDNVTKLGTPTTSNIPEGSNLYHTDARVNIVIGSSSITSPQVSPKITFTSPAAGQFLKIVDAQGNVENGTSSVSVDFSAVTGLPTDNTNFKIEAGTSTVPVRDSDGNLFASGIVGGTTTGALKIPIGTTAQRPGTPTDSMLRFNLSGSATGGIITTAGTWTIHTFTSSGTFTVNQSYGLEVYWGGTWTSVGSLPLPVEVLIVGGGGGGGAQGGGGGGGGGGVITTTLGVVGTNTIIIGAGGAGSTNGNNSSFSTKTAIGGGAGSTGTGGNGGSGGGGVAGGNGTADQGNNGGNNGGFTGTSIPKGGGGGAGAVGGNATANNQSGNGGVGSVSTISGTSTYYGGGGGGGFTWNGYGNPGGSGGNGGGGQGGDSPVAGTANTGGGGGGGGQSGTTGIGGSGIVIIRYPTS